LFRNYALAIAVWYWCWCVAVYDRWANVWITTSKLTCVQQLASNASERQVCYYSAHMLNDIAVKSCDRWRYSFYSVLLRTVSC